MSQKELTGEITEPVELHAEECATAAGSQLNITSAERSEIPAELFQLRKRKEDLKKWNKTIRDKLTGLEFQLRMKEAENENLLTEIDTLEEKEIVLTKKKTSLAAELVRIQRFIENKHKEIRKLKQKINELDWWVDDAEYDKEAQVEYLRTKMEAEINTVQKKLHNLQEREKCLHYQISHAVGELSQMESYRHKQKKSSLELTGALQDLEHEIQEAESLLMKSQEEIKKLDRIIAAKQDQMNKDREIKRLLAQDLKEQPSLLQEEKILADSEEIKNPVEEMPPNSGSWFPKYLLVGLGVTVGGLLIYSAFRAFSAS